MSQEVEIDLEEILGEVEEMDLEAIRAELVKDKTKQRVASKKYYKPETAKKARQRKAARSKAMEAKLKEAGLYDQVVAQARELADQQLAELEVEVEVE